MKIRLLLCVLVLLSLSGYGQSCTLNVALSQSAPTICSGNSIVLTATTSGGTAPFTYIWSTGEITTSINVNKAGTYTVSVSDKTAGCQPVKQSVTVNVSITPNAPTANGAVTCPNSSVTLKAIAPGGAYQWYDAPVAGNFLASSDTYTTPPINAPTTYYVETTVDGCTSARTAVNVGISGAPNVNGITICANNIAVLSASGGDSYSWYDAPNGNLINTGPTFTTPVLNVTTTYYVVVVANGCTSASTPVTATVTPPPKAPVASNITVCMGSSANLHADAPAGILNWFTTPVGGISLISSPDYTTPSLLTTTTYYVETSLNGCESPRLAVTITVVPLPAAPVLQNDTVCYGNSTTLTAAVAPSGTYRWYDAATGGNLLATGVTYTTPILKNSVTYYVDNTNGTCQSARSPINVIVKQQLPAPSVSGSIICSGTATTLTVTGPGGIYSWYDAAAGGKLLATGVSYTTPQLITNTTYYVQTTQSGCISPRAAVTVSILAAIPAPTASNVSVCSGNSAVLTATGPANNFEWYDAAVGGNLLSSGQVYAIPVLVANNTYYVEEIANGCASPRTAVKVTVIPLPASPTVTGATVCPNTKATLTASVAVGTIQWFDAATGGTLLKTGPTFTTPALVISTTYYIQNASGPCQSTRIPVTATVTSVANPQFQYSSGTFCVSSGNTLPAINDPAGGTFSAVPAGLVFVDNKTGEINISASVPGNYTISFASNALCAVPTNAKLAIVTTPNAQFSYSGPYCQGGANPLPTYPINATGGSFTASPAGLVFVNTSTGEIDLSQSKAGTYTVTNTLAANGACPQTTASSTVTIDQGAIVNAGPNQSIQTGGTAQLAGSITGGATNGTWAGGTGSFSNTSLLNAVYTPGAGEKKATLTLTSTDPPGPCGPKSSKVIITIGFQPAAPTVANVTVCTGSTATLSATAPGGAYEWYDAANGGNLLLKGPTFTTPPIIANIIYYVQTTNLGITSNRTAVTVSMNPIPVAPIAASSQTCTGSGTTLTVSGSAGTYAWYDAATGGNLLSVNNTYSTPAITVNTTYYAESVVNGCESTRTPVNVTVTPVPNITSVATGIVCSGTALNYIITADVQSATFLWSRALVAGISNPAVANQNKGTIDETLINTSATFVKVTYVITPLVGNCSGPSFQYVVTVNPTPVITGAAKITICNATSPNYVINFNVPGIDFLWSRATVAGISNAAVSSQNAGTIKEVLFNTTNAPIDVTYAFNYRTASCTGLPFNLVVTVNPQAVITSAGRGIACTGSPQDYVITSNIPTATFSWNRSAVASISNPAVSNQTSGIISEVLNNTGLIPINVVYIITPFINGCVGTPTRYIVTVNPPISIPIANANSPVCVGSAIHLRTKPVINATYLWSGPNGYKSTSGNPDITNVAATADGIYTLVITVNGCASQTATVAVKVNELPKAHAGPDQLVCIKNPFIKLKGSVTGGTSTGIWTTAGTGTFTPASDVLTAEYLPSDADRAAGAVVLTLTSTSKDDCAISDSSMTVRFGPLPAVIAGPSQEVCSQTTAVPLAGKVLIAGGAKWSSSGTGTFSPSDTQLGAVYLPSVADIKSGSVKIKLLAVNAGVCDIPTDSLIIKFIPPPTVNAEGIRYVLRGRTITLRPTISDENVKYSWSPNTDINDPTVKNPVITGDVDRTYTLTITDSRGCVAQDTTAIKVSPEIKVDNTFTPNGDGINDNWNITGLIAYEQATVDIFTRYGQKIFHSIGYPKAWDGTYNGKQLPVGVYYFVIDTRVNNQVFSGYVTIIR